MSFLGKYPQVDAGNGVTRQVLSHNEHLMVVSFTFTRGGEGMLHSHPHVQSTYVESGRFTFSIDGTTFDVKAGDSFIVPPNALHGCICTEEGRLIDTFAPRRDDFL
jgi:unsaturated pyranuronate lyase